MNKYFYHINLEERGVFSADVRDAEDKSIYEIYVDEGSDNSSTIFEDGFMRHTHDISGLEKHLKNLGLIEKGATLVSAEEEHDLESDDSEMKDGGSVGGNRYVLGNYNKKSVRNIVLNEGLHYAVYSFLSGQEISEKEESLRRNWIECHKEMQSFDRLIKQSKSRLHELVEREGIHYPVMYVMDINDPVYSDSSEEVKAAIQKQWRLLGSISSELGLDMDKVMKDGGSVKESAGKVFSVVYEKVYEDGQVSETVYAKDIYALDEGDARRHFKLMYPTTRKIIQVNKRYEKGGKVSLSEYKNGAEGGWKSKIKNTIHTDRLKALIGKEVTLIAPDDKVLDKGILEMNDDKDVCRIIVKDGGADWYFTIDEIAVVDNGANTRRALAIYLNESYNTNRMEKGGSIDHDTLTKQNISNNVKVQEKSHPEWGTFRVIWERSDGIWEIRGEAGVRLLYEDEFHFWKLIQSKDTMADKSKIDREDGTHSRSGLANSLNSEAMPNSYADKSAEQVWGAWTKPQRLHFLNDHEVEIENELAQIPDAKQIIPKTFYETSFDRLPDVIKNVLEQHLREGSYAKGGGVKAEVKITPYDDGGGTFWKVVDASGKKIDDGFDSTADAEMWAGDNGYSVKEEYAKGGGVGGDHSWEEMTTTGELKPVMSWTEHECRDFLAENWGFRGVDGKGLTKDASNRTLSYLRLEVLSQMKYNNGNSLANGGKVDEPVAKVNPKVFIASLDLSKLPDHISKFITEDILSDPTIESLPEEDADFAAIIEVIKGKYPEALPKNKEVESETAVTENEEEHSNTPIVMSVDSPKSAGKIKIESISLSGGRGGNAASRFTLPLNNMSEVNDKFATLAGRGGYDDVSYVVKFTDGEELSGSIDTGLKSFFNDKPNPVQWHLKTFWGNLANRKPDAIYDVETVSEAKQVVNNYDFDFAATAAVSPAQEEAKPSKAILETRLKLLDKMIKKEKDKAKKKIYETRKKIVAGMIKKLDGEAEKFAKGGSVGGSGWGKLKKGKQIKGFDLLKVGDIVLNADSRFKTKNVVKITEVVPERGIAYGEFINPKKLSEKRLEDDGKFAIWKHSIEGNFGDKYYATTHKSAPVVVESYYEEEQNPLLSGSDIHGMMHNKKEDGGEVAKGTYGIDEDGVYESLYELYPDNKKEAKSRWKAMSKESKDGMVHFLVVTDAASEGNAEAFLKFVGEKPKEWLKKMEKGDDVSETHVISYLDKKNKFQKTDKVFKGKDFYEQAVRWGKDNLDNFHIDMVHSEMEKGGSVKPTWVVDYLMPSSKYRKIERGFFTKEEAEKWAKAENIIKEADEFSIYEEEFSRFGDGDKAGMIKISTESSSWDVDNMADAVRIIRQVRDSADYDNSGRRGYGIKITIAEYGKPAKTKTVRKWLQELVSPAYSEGGAVRDFDTWKGELITLIMKEANMTEDEIALTETEIKGYFDQGKTPHEVYFDEFGQDAGHFWKLPFAKGGGIKKSKA